VQKPVKQPTQQSDILYVTWSARGIRIAYADAMVAYVKAEDVYPLATKAKVGSLFACEQRSMVPSPE
jgi:hypothetical protein